MHFLLTCLIFFIPSFFLYLSFFSTILHFSIQPSDTDSQPLEVTHFHFTAWPDHGVPQFATSLISFIKRVQKSHDKDRGVPLVVHCSAGVGRTGTFVMLDSMMDRLKVEDSINVYEFLRQMRSKRMYMVQTLVSDIYIYIYTVTYMYISVSYIIIYNYTYIS